MIDLLKTICTDLGITGPALKARVIRCRCKPGQWPCECDKTIEVIPVLLSPREAEVLLDITQRKSDE